MGPCSRWRRRLTCLGLAIVCLTALLNQPADASQLEEPCETTFTRCGETNCSDRLPGLDILFRGQKPFFRQNCRCDAMCEMYGDCCLDYWQRCAHHQRPRGAPLPETILAYSGYLDCVRPIRPLKPNHLLAYIYAVGRCPADWPGADDDVRRACENQTLAESRPFLTLPVNGPGEVVFKNVMCAVCHGVPIDRLQPWSLDTWDCLDGALNASTALDLDQCAEFTLNPPASMSSEPHTCFPTYVDTCPAGAGVGQAALCRNHTAVVFGHVQGAGLDPVPYKNGHCLNCSRDQITGSRCFVFGGLRLSPWHSHTLLFDFRERTVSLPDGEVVRRCGPGRVPDPFLGACVELSCSAGWNLISGRCTPPEGAAMRAFPRGDRAGGCHESLVSHPGLAGYLADGSGRLSVSSGGGDAGGTAPARIYLRAAFSIAERISQSLDAFVRTVGSGNADAPCLSTEITLVARSRERTNETGLAVCPGFTLPGVGLSEIDLSEGEYVADGGLAYAADEFVHVTVHEPDAAAVNASSSTPRAATQYVQLCSPFAETDCPVISYARSEFLLTAGGGAVHRASGVTVPAADLWQLPDGTLRLCYAVPEEAGPTVAYPAWLTRLSDLSVAGSSISVASMLLALLTYALFPALRNKPGKVIMNLMVALVLGQVALALGRPESHWLCVLRATFLHFSWLAAFLWMTLLSCSLTSSIKSRTAPVGRDEVSRYAVLRLSLLAWGGPAVFVLACYVASRLRGWAEYGGPDCWIVDPLHSFLVFGVPVASLLAANALLLALMIYTVVANRTRLAALRMARNARNELRTCSKLLIITGTSWSLYFAANKVDSVALWYAAVLVNSFHGATISFMFLLKASVRKLWRRRLAEWRARLAAACRRRPPARVRRLAGRVAAAIGPAGGEAETAAAGVWAGAGSGRDSRAARTLPTAAGPLARLAWAGATVSCPTGAQTGTVTATESTSYPCDAIV